MGRGARLARGLALPCALPSVPAATLPAGMEWAGIVLAYLLGSVPFGLLFVRVIKGIDLRTVGSGNIGATNAMRVLGKPLGIAAGLCDFAKGGVPALLFAGVFDAADGLSPAWLSVACGGAAVCGHVWPVYLRFRGGKAVATGLGTMLALDPVVGLAGAASWFVTLKVFRFTGLASMVMATVWPLVAWLRVDGGPTGWPLVWGATALWVLILWRHRSNVGRMLRGEEPRAGARIETRAGESRA